MKKKILVYVPGTYISPFVVALAAGVNSNPSSRERFFLRTANPRQDPNSCIHYDVIWRHYSSTSTGGRHQVMQQQTGSEPPNRCPPELLVKTYITHTHTVVHLSTGGRHQVKMQQTGSEPPNRNPPELLVIHTSHIHTLFRYRRQHYVRVFSHIGTRYFSEGSVQHPPPFSFHRRVRIKNKTPSRTNQQYVVQ